MFNFTLMTEEMKSMHDISETPPPAPASGKEVQIVYTVRAPLKPAVCIFFTPFFSAREVNITNHLST